MNQIILIPTLETGHEAKTAQSVESLYEILKERFAPDVTSHACLMAHDSTDAKTRARYLQNLLKRTGLILPFGNVSSLILAIRMVCHSRKVSDFIVFLPTEDARDFATRWKQDEVHTKKQRKPLDIKMPFVNDRTTGICFDDERRKVYVLSPKTMAVR